jgi:hypothetical protein
MGYGALKPFAGLLFREGGGIEWPIKKPQPCRVEVFLLVEAAGTVFRG